MTAPARPLDVLMLNTLVGVGGAAAVALDLARAFRRHGHRCQIVAGWTVGTAEKALSLPLGHPYLRAAIDWVVRCFGHIPFVQRRLAMLERLKQQLEFPLPLHREFDYAGPAGSRRLLAVLPRRPDVVHAHNLHGWHFDLRALPVISARAPVVLTLHDAWMLSGHCAHSFDCTRWKIGCGECPDLSIPVALPFDHSAENWRVKAAIYRKSRLRVATPSRWLMDKVQQSMLQPAVIEGRVIHNGVDTAVFKPGDRQKERRALGLPEDAIVLLFVANGIKQNIWKDYSTLEAAIGRLAVPVGRKVLFVALGEEGTPQRIGDAEIRFVAAVAAGDATAAYYRAADLYVHAARADTFPNVVIESLACGTPVVATAVGGIPEQIRSAGGAGADPAFAVADLARATGVLTPARNAEAFAAAISHLCADPATLVQLGRNAARDASERFDLDRQAGVYLEWFDEIRERWSVERWSNKVSFLRSSLASPLVN
jgi:glycosyltransferase involved in cell wall biosynthesis